MGSRGARLKERGFVRICDGQGRAGGVRGVPEPLLRRLLDHPEELLWGNVERPVKIDYGTMIVEADLLMASTTAHVAWKRYRPRGWRKGLLSLFRRSQGQRAWRLGHALLSRGIATARPLAVIETRRFRFPRVSYLATEWIEGAENLHLFGWRLAGVPLEHRLRVARGCAVSLGVLAGRMHAEHIAHRDLKAANLLVQADARAGDGAPQVYLVDVDGVRMERRLSNGRRAADLARLGVGLHAHPWVTRSLCCRFLRAYVSQFPANTVGWKTLWRQVDVRRRAMVERKQRRDEQVL